jgi:hypothetical protein
MADMNSPLDRTAFDGLSDYAREAVVFLVDGALGANSRTAGVGSGTLFRTQGGRTVVLTAAHNFDDVPDDGMSVGGKTPDGVSDAFEVVWRHPVADVALALLRRKAAEIFGGFALSPELVAATADTAFEEENPMVLCGYPGDYRRTFVAPATKTAHVEFACISYATMVEPSLDSHGRYRARWREAVLTENDPVVPAVKPGEVFVITRPHGISGGPLWRFRKRPKADLWAPSKMGQIVGIASTYIREDAVEFCPSVAVWGDWFRDTLVAVDTA